MDVGKSGLMGGGISAPEIGGVGVETECCRDEEITSDFKSKPLWAKGPVGG